MSSDQPDQIAPPDLAPFQSRQWCEVLDAARAAAVSREPVLIVGECGTGRTQVARLIHHLSPRHGNPSREWQILTAEWGDPRLIAFGTVEGYRDPSKGWQGIFPRCAGGTLLVDYADSLPAGQQGVIDEFLRHSLVFPVGATEPYAVDARFILVAEEAHPTGHPERASLLPSLRERLKGNLITLPPLRKRREDIRTLLAFELGRVRDELGLREPWEPPVFTKEAVEYIEQRLLPRNGWHLRKLAFNVWFETREEILTLPLLMDLLAKNDHDLDGSRSPQVRPSRRTPRCAAGGRRTGGRDVLPGSRM
jgi:DNA-binding NtrC family response regulator